MNIEVSEDPEIECCSQVCFCMHYNYQCHHVVKSFLFWCPCPVECEAYSSGVTRKENIFSLCELCVSSETGGELAEKEVEK